MKTKKFTVLIIFFSFVFAASPKLKAQTKSEVDIFISLFAETAVSEMERSGVLASITLGQGILESNAGRSHLVLEGNNYFGIKCGSKWKGSKVGHKDDDYNEQGKLINSCFRSYATPQESFVDHSDFLRRKRYKILFSYGKNYKEWAHGLQHCGYATDKKYGNTLIRIIEKYNLQQYDTKSSIQADMVENNIPARRALNNEVVVETAITPPPATILADDYKRDSQAVQNPFDDKSGLIATEKMVIDNNPSLIDSQLSNQRNIDSALSSQSIVLKRKYKSKYAVAK